MEISLLTVTADEWEERGGKVNGNVERFTRDCYGRGSEAVSCKHEAEFILHQ